MIFIYEAYVIATIPPSARIITITSPIDQVLGWGLR